MSDAEFSRTLDGMSFKNPVRREGGWLYVQLPTPHYPYSAVFTANASDAERLAPHRWRMVGERIVTTMPDDDGVEVPVGVENVLLMVPRKTTVPHKNGDVLDCRRVNLAAARKAPKHTPNAVTVKGNEAFIDCKRVQVTIDREDLPRVQSYRWTAVDKGTNQTHWEIKAKAPTPERPTRTVLLAKVLLDLPHHQKHVLTFKDGNRLNFKKSNLAVQPRFHDA